MKYLHIMTPSKRMMLAYVSMLRKHFPAGDHKILYRGNVETSEAVLLQFENTVNFSSLGKGKLNKYKGIKKLMKEADHIILHGFNLDWKWILFFCMNKDFLKKICWVIWGIDMYNYLRPETSLKNKILNKMETYCRTQAANAVALLEADVPVYKSKFGDREVLCAGYPISERNWIIMDKYLEDMAAQNEEEKKSAPTWADYGIIDKIVESVEDQTAFKLTVTKNNGNVDVNIESKAIIPAKPPIKTIKVLCGNNAHSFNKHSKTLFQLQKFINEDIKLYVPISYGNDYVTARSGYIQGLKSLGNELYPSTKCAFMTKLMPQHEYTKFLTGLHAGIFNAERQNALGNINKLLYMGKKVYLSRKNPLFDFYVEKGFEIHDIDELDNITFEEFASPVKTPFPNPWLKAYYSIDGAAEHWRNVFEYIEKNNK